MPEMQPTPSRTRTTAPPDACLYIIGPGQGDRLRGAFLCRFGLRNMGVTHAGDTHANRGHYHLLVDVTEPLDPDEPIPTDKNQLPFGAGQTEARLDLPPGRHTLQLVLAGADHRLFDPPVISRAITLDVGRGTLSRPPDGWPGAKTARKINETKGPTGWGTWIRTKDARVRAGSFTAKLSPKRRSNSEIPCCRRHRQPRHPRLLPERRKRGAPRCRLQARTWPKKIWLEGRQMRRSALAHHRFVARRRWPEADEAAPRRSQS